MNHDYAALIKSARDIPVLSTGIEHSVTPESNFPTKEHPSLLTHTGKTVNTPLTSTLSARYIKLPSSPKDPHYADRHTLASIKKNALTLTFRGHRDGKVPRIEWDQYYLHLLPLVLEHPKLMLAESKQMTETLRRIYKASSDFIGDASLSAEQQVALKTRSLCLPLLADNPWEPPNDEEETISTIVLEDRGFDAIPADGSDDRAKYDNTVVQYSRTMAYLREILNHTFMRAVYHTSIRQAKLEYEEVQRNFINDHSNDDPDDEPVKFTAKVIIEYIERECLCSNEKAVQSIKIAISKMVRYNNQSLLDWLQSFVQPVNKYIKAMSIDALDDDDAKEVWKDHFVKQIMLSEITQLLLFRKEHLTPYEIRQVNHLSAGDFREKTLQKLVTKLSSNFEPYKPDKAILLYLNQHTRQLGLDAPSFANPKDKQSSSDKSERKQSDNSDKKRKYKSDRFDKKRKRTDASESKSKSSSDSRSKSRSGFKAKPSGSTHDNKRRGKIPFGEQCRRINCKQRGSSASHRHEECRFKDVDHTVKHPNLGRAPSKKKDQRSNNSGTASQASTPSAERNTVRKCYICSDPNHLANACPQKGKHKQNAKTKLAANSNFLTLFRSSFKTQDEQACASRMIDSWEEDQICPHCIQPCYFAHECNTNDTRVTQHVPHVRQTIANTSLLFHIQEAHKPHSERLIASNPVSMNTSFFLQAEGHDVSNMGDLSPIRQQHGRHHSRDNHHSSDDEETRDRSDSEQDSLREDDSQSESASDSDAGYHSHTESEQSSHNEFSDDQSDGAGIQPDD